MSAGFKPELHQVPVPPMQWDAGDPALAAPLSEERPRSSAECSGFRGNHPPPPSTPNGHRLAQLSVRRRSRGTARHLVGDGFASTADAGSPAARGRQIDSPTCCVAASPPKTPRRRRAPATDEEGRRPPRLVRGEPGRRRALRGGTSVVGGSTPMPADPRRDHGGPAPHGRADRPRRGIPGRHPRRGRHRPGRRGATGERGYPRPLPQSFRFATIGGFAVTRSSGQASAGYGRFDDMVQALTLVTPRGTLRAGRSPKNAVGPDLRQLVMGPKARSASSLCVSVRVHRTRGHRVRGWRFNSFTDAAAAFRAVAQEGVMPTVMRVSDEVETAQPGSPTEIGRVPMTICRTNKCPAAVWRSPRSRFADRRRRPRRRRPRDIHRRRRPIPSAPVRRKPGNTAASPARTCATRCSISASAAKRSGDA